jgi:ubiquinone/menaquinone biosynthesis C-methylase UbiE
MTWTSTLGGWLGAPYKLVELNLRRPIGPLGHLLGHTMAWSHLPLTRWTISHMDVRPSDRILDLGCGGGKAIQLLSRLVPDGFVAGLDHSKAMVAQSRQRNAAAVARGKVEVSLGTVDAIPHRDSTFDKVSAIETFYYWPDPVAGLREARRVLSPGGTMVVALEMSRESSRQGSRLRRSCSEAYVAGAIQRGQVVPSGPELVELLLRSGFREARFVSEPERALGWLCAIATA